MVRSGLRDRHIYACPPSNTRGSHRKATDLSERLLVVEYDGRPPSPWVPYPLGFSLSCEACSWNEDLVKSPNLEPAPPDSAANYIQLWQNGKTNSATGTPGSR